MQLHSTERIHRHEPTHMSRNKHPRVQLQERPAGYDWSPRGSCANLLMLGVMRIGQQLRGFVGGRANAEEAEGIAGRFSSNGAICVQHGLEVLEQLLIVGAQRCQTQPQASSMLHNLHVPAGELITQRSNTAYRLMHQLAGAAHPSVLGKGSMVGTMRKMA